MRTLIVGAGALGGFYGALLAKAGNEVIVLARGATLDALHANGLTIISEKFGSITQPVTVIDNPTDAGSVDLIFFAVKAYDLERAARQIAPLVSDSTTVLSIQNGIEHPRRLAEIVGEEAVLPGVVIISATVEQPGTIRHVAGPALIQLGDIGVPRPERLAQVASVFQDAGVPIETHIDLRPKLWFKFGLIAAMSGVTALTRLTLAHIFAVPETRQFFREVIDEVMLVAGASGVEMAASTPDDIIAMLEAQRPMMEYGSMAYDLFAGRRLEIETLNGSVARLGQQLGVATPMNQAITAALLPYKDGPPAKS